MKRTSSSGLRAALLVALPLASFACAEGVISPPDSHPPSDAPAVDGATNDGDDAVDITDDEDGALEEAPMADGADGAEDTPNGGDDTPPNGDDQAPAKVSQTLTVEGRHLLDTCGNRFVVRGVEQVFGFGIEVNGSHIDMVDEIAKTGANAVRVLPNLAQLGVAEVDAILARVVSHKMVVFLSPGDRSWFAKDDVQAMLDKYESWLVVDAFQEPNYDDRARWQADAMGSIDMVRGEGYDEPITVLANLYGRDLPSLLMYGKDVVEHDPLSNTVLGWQAYWGINGYYQGHFDMQLAEAFSTIAAQPFPIQAGIDGFADPGEAMDYVGAMAAAHGQDVGWLWWDWYNPFGNTNNLTTNGRSDSLTPLGMAVVRQDANGLGTAKKACGL